MRRRFGRRQRHPSDTPLDQHEREILAALAALRDTVAHEVMTPRVDVVALRAPVTAADVSLAVKESGHSRFPVYEDDLDHLVGVLFVKDLFRMDEITTEAIARRLRRPFQIPEGKLVLELLHEMRAGRHAFAVVVDEYGGVAGVLTVKDLVSELVGDLRDEFDPEIEQEIIRVDTNRWLVDGGCSVDQVREELGVAIPDGEYVTAAGFVLSKLGRIPEEGDELEHDGVQLRVAEMEKRRVAKIVVRVPSSTIAGLPSEGSNGM